MAKKMPQSVDPIDISNLIYAKLLSPFSTVICLFANDLNGLGAVAKTLASWLINMGDSQSDLPPSTYPRLIILKRADNLDVMRASTSFESYLEMS
jgi:hypothetical protein